MSQGTLFTRGIAEPTTSAGDCWETPPALFEAISRQLGGFDLDVCASPETAKCGRYFTELDNGLSKAWHPWRCFCNPPYSTWAVWAEKAAAEARLGASVAMLIPPKTEHVAWHRFVMQADWIVFLRGRVSFHVDGKPKSGNTYGSALVVFDSAGRWKRIGKLGPEVRGWDWRDGR